MENTNFDIIKFFLKTVNHAQNETLNHKDYDILKNNYHLHSDKNKYVMNVFRYYHRIIDFNDDIKKVEVFLRRFPNSKFLNENDIDQLTYIKYHMEVLFHKVHTVLELKKLMINEVYEIGLKEKDCSWENLKRHKNVKNKPAMLIVSNYYKTFGDVISARHINTHRGYYNDKSEIDISAPLNIYKWSENLEFDLGNFSLFMPKFIVEYKLKKLRKKRIDYVKDTLKATTYYQEEFFKYILIDFRERYQKWKK